MIQKLSVIDFFCGAGGFSEGFRQQGFKVVAGIDNWQPAIDTHNLNHNLHDIKKDILDFESIDEINKLPDTEIIIGSPPCVLFSQSNSGGNKDKTLGIKLIEAYLKVVAIKKHQKSSKLKAWFMENVPNSRNYIKTTYTFQDLGLEKWARKNGIDPSKIALNGSINGQVINTADFGASQSRKRFVCGEITSTGKFPNIDKYAHCEHKNLDEIISKMPRPNSSISKNLFNDPNYPNLKFTVEEITDHFYDSGLYESNWKSAKYAKTNHPYMGVMSFPENFNKPSRTVMATRAMSSRETLVYKSEYERVGDGEYRLPTIRELASIMGFPYSYQFFGAENTKCRLIGNAVCPQLSTALAKTVKISLGVLPTPISKIIFNKPDISNITFKNLNTFSKKKFDKPPTKKQTAKFRKHTFKEKNMTVALTNFNPIDIKSSLPTGSNWFSSIFFGTGKSFETFVIPKDKFKYIGSIIEKEYGKIGSNFISGFEKKFGDIFGKSNSFQDAYVKNDGLKEFDPGKIIDRIGEYILECNCEQKFVYVTDLLPDNKKIPTSQIFAMYAINRIVS